MAGMILMILLLFSLVVDAPLVDSVFLMVAFLCHVCRTDCFKRSFLNSRIVTYMHDMGLFTI